MAEPSAARGRIEKKVRFELDTQSHCSEDQEIAAATPPQVTNAEATCAAAEPDKTESCPPARMSLQDYSMGRRQNLAQNIRRLSAMVEDEVAELQQQGLLTDEFQDQATTFTTLADPLARSIEECRRRSGPFAELQRKTKELFERRRTAGASHEPSEQPIESAKSPPGSPDPASPTEETSIFGNAQTATHEGTHEPNLSTPSSPLQSTEDQSENVAHTTEEINEHSSPETPPSTFPAPRIQWPAFELFRDEDLSESTTEPIHKDMGESCREFCKIPPRPEMRIMTATNLSKHEWRLSLVGDLPKRPGYVDEDIQDEDEVGEGAAGEDVVEQGLPGDGVVREVGSRQDATPDDLPHEDTVQETDSPEDILQQGMRQPEALQQDTSRHDTPQDVSDETEDDGDQRNAPEQNILEKGLIRHDSPQQHTPEHHRPHQYTPRHPPEQKSPQQAAFEQNLPQQDVLQKRDALKLSSKESLLSSTQGAKSSSNFDWKAFHSTSRPTPSPASTGRPARPPQDTQGLFNATDAGQKPGIKLLRPSIAVQNATPTATDKGNAERQTLQLSNPSPAFHRPQALPRRSQPASTARVPTLSPQFPESLSPKQNPTTKSSLLSANDDPIPTSQAIHRSPKRQRSPSIPSPTTRRGRAPLVCLRCLQNKIKCSHEKSCESCNLNDWRCEYIVCNFGLGCRSTKCIRVHPGQIDEGDGGKWNVIDV